MRQSAELLGADAGCHLSLKTLSALGQPLRRRQGPAGPAAVHQLTAAHHAVSAEPAAEVPRRLQLRCVERLAAGGTRPLLQWERRVRNPR